MSRACLGLFLVLMGCGCNAGVGLPSPLSPAAPTQAAPFYVAYHRALNSYPAAELGAATLVVESGCLWLRSGKMRWLPLWPESVALRVGEPETLMERGEVVARVGQPISVGGGEYQPAEAAFAISLIDGNPPPAECAGGLYWLVSEVR